MSSNLYIYNDIFLKRLVNKFYFIKTKKLPLIKESKCEFHNIKNEKEFLTLYSFIEEFFGLVPYFVKKGFNYNFEGKKLFIKDIRVLISNNNTILNILKYIYFCMSKKSLRSKLITRIGNNGIYINLLMSDLDLRLQREIFFFLNNISFDIKFTIKNRFLLSYFLLNFKFLNNHKNI